MMACKSAVVLASAVAFALALALAWVSGAARTIELANHMRSMASAGHRSRSAPAAVAAEDEADTAVMVDDEPDETAGTADMLDEADTVDTADDADDEVDADDTVDAGTVDDEPGTADDADDAVDAGESNSSVACSSHGSSQRDSVPRATSSERTAGSASAAMRMIETSAVSTLAKKKTHETEKEEL